ncbi:hypothetical protein CALCODRAFT_484890 [Calocera cornea HHB12733]|uniref:Ricin B lectin domain-containing protein n=1 Tax=Calocera cornea HHB12733 TaxID=1353952 RepID=A0A165EQM0_9BASI|nr:hypothetical protein CALCODRAFT_484890 [Calocera cornea HHB12733]
MSLAPTAGGFPGKAIIIPNGIYNIINVASGTSLRIKGTEHIVGDARELPFNKQPEEEWILKYDTVPSSYSIQNKSNGSYLTWEQLFEPLVAGHTELFQAPKEHLSYFGLRLSKVTGAFAINPVEGPQLVELFQGSSAPGTSVRVADGDGSTKQLWSFAAVPA